MSKLTYNELLTDPRWLDKRESILTRDNHQCVSCAHKGEEVNQLGQYLHVHHLFYKKGLLPWDYKDDELITLCDNCHEYITRKLSSCTELIGRICKDDDASEQLEFILNIILKMNNPWQIRKFAKSLENLQ